MKLYVPALVSIAPALVNGYGMGGRFFTTSPMTAYTPGAMMRRQRALANQVCRQRSSPRYEITDTDDKFQLAVDVPGVKASDINVSIEDDVLTLSGERKMDKDSYSFASKFYQNFSLDPAIVTEEFTAELKNGVLYIAAPKDFQRIEENVQRIPVKQVSEDETVETSNVKEEIKNEADELSEAQHEPSDDKDDAGDGDEATPTA